MFRVERLHYLQDVVVLWVPLSSFVCVQFVYGV